MLKAYPELALNPRQVTLLVIAVLLALFGFYVVTIDQGQILSFFQGQQAFDLNWMHEFTHDARHASGIPCH